MISEISEEKISSHIEVFRDSAIRYCTRGDCPKGLGSIPDSIQSLATQEPAKPPLLKRLFVSTLLFGLHIFLLSLHFFFWIIDRIASQRSEKSIFKELLKTIDEQDDLIRFLKTSSTKGGPAGFVMREFLALPEFFEDLKEILGGANVCLLGDNGFFCNQWSKNPEAHQRISSHQYRGKECYELGHFLFWIDLDGNTRFQLENTPVKGFRNAVYHLFDLLKYWRDNEQQGVVGTSKYTEKFCLSIAVDPKKYLIRKALDRLPVGKTPSEKIN